MKVAILEDNKVLLKERKNNLEENELAKVVVWAREADEFLEKVKSEKPQALFLDIELDNKSTMKGLDVAYMLKLPVMFVSAFNAQNLKQIESLKRENDFPVEHITKPFSEQEFIKAARKFLDEVRDFNNSYVYLSFKGKEMHKIRIDDIVYLCSNKAEGAASNNKEIYFTDRKQEVLVDFSFSKMEDLGLKKNKFITVHRSYIVNEKHIKSYNKTKQQIEVWAVKDGKAEQIFLPVSENFKMT